jgi:hypothetical protein
VASRCGLETWIRDVDWVASVREAEEEFVERFQLLQNAVAGSRRARGVLHKQLQRAQTTARNRSISVDWKRFYQYSMVQEKKINSVKLFVHETSSRERSDA